jgi:hypothetical protein
MIQDHKMLLWLQTDGIIASRLRVFFSVRLELGKDGPAALPRHYGPSDLHLIATYLKDGGRAYSQLHRALLARVQDAGLEALLEPPPAPPAEAPAVGSGADKALQLVGPGTGAGEESGKGGDKRHELLSGVGGTGASRSSPGEERASEKSIPAAELITGGPQVAETASGVQNELAPEALKETSPKRPSESSVKPTANPPPQLLTSPSPSPSTRDADTSLRQIESGQDSEPVADVRLTSLNGAGQTEHGAATAEASHEWGLDAGAEKVSGKKEIVDKVVETCTLTPETLEDQKVSAEGPGAVAKTGNASEKGSGREAERAFEEATPSGKVDTSVNTASRAAESLGGSKSGEEKEDMPIVIEAGGIGNGAAVMASAVVPVGKSTLELVGGKGTELEDAGKGGAVLEVESASDGAGQSSHNIAGGIFEARDLLIGIGQGIEALEKVEPLAVGVQGLGVSHVRKQSAAGVSQDQRGLPTEAGSALGVLDGSARQFVEGTQIGARALEASQVGGWSDSQPLMGVTGGLGGLGVVASSVPPAPGGLEGLGMADVSGNKRHSGERDPLACHESALFDFDNIEDLVEKLAREQGYLVDTGPLQSGRSESITTGPVAGGVDSAAPQSGPANLPLQSVTTFPQQTGLDSTLPAGEPKPQGPVEASNGLPLSSPLSGRATGRPEQGPSKRQKLELPPLYKSQAYGFLNPQFQHPFEAFAPPILLGEKPQSGSENRQENVSALTAASKLALPSPVTGLGQPHVSLPVHSATCPPPLLNPTLIGAAAVRANLVSSIRMTSASGAGAPDPAPAQKPPWPKLRWPFDDVSADVPSPKPTLGSGQAPPSLAPASGGPVSSSGQPLPSGTRPRAEPTSAKTRPPSGSLVGRNLQLANPLPASTGPSAPTDSVPLKPYERYENRYVQGGLAAQAAAQLQEMGDKKESVAKASGKWCLSFEVIVQERRNLLQGNEREMGLAASCWRLRGSTFRMKFRESNQGRYLQG